MLIDVVLPCLNEAAALPWVLSRMPSGYRAIVADNGSDDGSAEIAERYGALVVSVPLRGFGAACHGGLMAATSDVVCFMDADGSLDPRDLPVIAGPVLAGTEDLVLGRRRPEGPRSWPLHARVGNRVIVGAVRRRTAIRLRDLGPMRAARRVDLVRLGLLDRRFGYPLEMVVRAAESGWRVAERDVPYLQRAGRSKVTGTVSGTVRTARDMTRVLAAVTGTRHRRARPPSGRKRQRDGPRGAARGHCQGAGSRPGQDPADAAVQPAPGGAAGRGGAARHARGGGGSARGRHLIALDGAPGCWLPRGFEVIGQRGRGLDERIAAALGDAYASLPVPVVLIGMDTPQVTSGQLEAALRPLAAGAADAVLGPAADGGFWLLGLRRPDPALVVGVPMSTSRTGAVQLARLAGAGLRVARMPCQIDVDTAADADAVAEQIPASRFAATLRAAYSEKRGDREP